MTIIRRQGVTLHYQLEGLDTAPVLVLSNSLGTDLSMWSPQIDRLKAHFRVLRYDVRGHGASGQSDEPFTIADLASDVLAIMDDAGIGKARFCGLSMGGMTGMWLAANHAHRFSCFVLANTATVIGPASGWNTRIDTVRAGGMQAIVSAVLARWFTPGFLMDHPAQVTPVEQMLRRMAPEGYTAACVAVRDADLRSVLDNITAPVLVIVGTHDSATSAAQGGAIADAISGAQYMELPAAHLSNWQLPEVFTDIIVTFCSHQD